jgi:porin
MRLKYLALFLLYIIFNPVLSARDDDTLKRFSAGFAYTGDAVSNLRGGIKQGSTYLGIVNLNLQLRIGKRGYFFINAANTHGGEPSITLTGDYQVFSNIEAGNHTYLQELWFQQSWKHTDLCVGLQDLNVNIANIPAASLFLNSSFGILPTVSTNVPAPIFPLTSMGIFARTDISPSLSLLGAVFDGEPTDFEKNPHNLKWDFTRKDGFLFFLELQKSFFPEKTPLQLKAGVYRHQHFFDDDYNLYDNNSVHRNNYGLYLLGEKDIWHNQQRSVKMFLQLGLSPEHFNPCMFYGGYGINVSGLFFRNGTDNAGIALAYGVVKGFPGNELTIEFTWQLPVFSYFFIQPDVQYIINPAGTGTKLSNSVAATLRFGLIFP